MKPTTPLLLAFTAQLVVLPTVGCKKPADPPAEDTSSNAAPVDPVTAPVEPSNATDVGPTAATDPLPPPPELKVEEPGPAPSENHVWIEGYWWWDVPKREYIWSPGFWQDRLAYATTAPPALVYENPGRGPGEDYLYIPGSWIWRGTEWTWYHGYWGYHRDGWAYAHPFYTQHDGRWGCTSWGWEQYHPGWEAEHVGWEFHGGVWETHADFEARVGLARGHAGDFRVAPGTWHGHVWGRADGPTAGRPASGEGHPGDTVHEPSPHPPAPVAHGGHNPAPGAGRPGEPGHTPPAGHPGEPHPGEPHPSEPGRGPSRPAEPAGNHGGEPHPSGHAPPPRPAHPSGHYETHPKGGHAPEHGPEHAPEHGPEHGPDHGHTEPPKKP